MFLRWLVALAAKIAASLPAFAQNIVEWDSAGPARMPESEHVFSMSVKVTGVIGDLATKEGRAKAVAWWKKHRIKKLWLESYRHGRSVSSELLAEERDAFRAEGFGVCGMITPTSLSVPTPKQKEGKFWITCWSDPVARERIREECARAARLFDTVILDDFMFSMCNDKCARCTADKAARKIDDWGEYRRELLFEVCERDILPTVRTANPKSHFIIKYPCWYRDIWHNGYDYAQRGYSPVRQAELFGECWIGTETRDANPEPLQACWIAAWMDAITGGRCGGGWYDPLDCSPEKFVEQARYTILGGMKESIIHCYDYLLSEDPGVMYESSARSHDCRRAFEREIDNLAALADKVRGAERGKFEMLPCGVSRHEFRKDGRAFAIFVNTKGMPVRIPGSGIVLGPHEMRESDKDEVRHSTIHKGRRQ